MRNGLIVIAVVLTACKKTGDNQYEVVRPGLVVDTVNAPAVGTKQTEIRRPTTKRP